jgi:hypothetical protein
MMKLTDTQIQILAAAAEHPDRPVEPPAIPPGPRGAIKAKLRNGGLTEPVRLDSAESRAMAWRHAEGKAVGCRITEAALAALQASKTGDTGMPAGAPMLAAERDEVTAGGGLGADEPEQPLAPLPESNAGLPDSRRPALRDAAHEMIHAWDLADAIGGFRAALAGKPPRAQRDANTSPGRVRAASSSG